MRPLFSRGTTETVCIRARSVKSSLRGSVCHRMELGLTSTISFRSFPRTRMENSILPSDPGPKGWGQPRPTGRARHRRTGRLLSASGTAEPRAARPRRQSADLVCVLGPICVSSPPPDLKQRPGQENYILLFPGGIKSPRLLLQGKFYKPVMSVMPGEDHTV